MLIVDKIIELIYPSSIYCMSCGNIIDESRNYSLCNECFGRFKWIDNRTCIKCGKRLGENNIENTCYDCMYNQHEFDKGYACVQYGTTEKQLIFNLKYNKKTYIARVMAEIMHDRILIEDLDYDIVIPVPIHKNKNRKRGFNQAGLVAKYFCKKQCTKINNNIVSRVTDTEPLKSKDPIERKMSLIKAFKVEDKAKSLIYNKKVLIIDDIYTTGATVDALSKVLRKEGVSKIYFLVFAIGGDLNNQ